MPSAGKLDRRIVVQHAVKVQDPGTGQPTLEWQDYLERWAEVRHLAGRELLIVQQLVATADTQFLTRYDEQIKTVTADESFRVAYENRLYDVQYSHEKTDERRRSVWRILARARAEEAA